MKKTVTAIQNSSKRLQEEEASEQKKDWSAFNENIDVLSQTLDRLYEILPTGNDSDSLQTLEDVVKQARKAGFNRLFVNADSTMVQKSQEKSTKFIITVDVKQETPYTALILQENGSYQEIQCSTKDEVVEKIKNADGKVEKGDTDIFYIGEESSVGQDFKEFTSTDNHELFVVPSKNPEFNIQMAGRSRTNNTPTFVQNPDHDETLKTQGELREAVLTQTTHDNTFYASFDGIKASYEYQAKLDMLNTMKEACGAQSPFFGTLERLSSCIQTGSTNIDATLTEYQAIFGEGTEPEGLSEFTAYATALVAEEFNMTETEEKFTAWMTTLEAMSKKAELAAWNYTASQQLKTYCRKADGGVYKASIQSALNLEGLITTFIRNAGINNSAQEKTLKNILLLKVKNTQESAKELFNKMTVDRDTAKGCDPAPTKEFLEGAIESMKVDPPKVSSRQIQALKYTQHSISTQLAHQKTVIENHLQVEHQQAEADRINRKPTSSSKPAPLQLDMSKTKKAPTSPAASTPGSPTTPEQLKLDEQLVIDFMSLHAEKSVPEPAEESVPEPAVGQTWINTKTRTTAKINSIQGDIITYEMTKKGKTKKKTMSKSQFIDHYITNGMLIK